MQLVLLPMLARLFFLSAQELSLQHSCGYGRMIADSVTAAVSRIIILFRGSAEFCLAVAVRDPNPGVTSCSVHVSHCLSARPSASA